MTYINPTHISMTISDYMSIGTYYSIQYAHFLNSVPSCTLAYQLNLKHKRKCMWQGRTMSLGDRLNLGRVERCHTQTQENFPS